MRRALILVVPNVFWNLCQSPESIYRECIFQAAVHVTGDEMPRIFQTPEVRALCREAADLPADKVEEASFDRERDKPHDSGELKRRAALREKSRLDQLRDEDAGKSN
jgi:hypothetical protein